MKLTLLVVVFVVAFIASVANASEFYERAMCDAVAKGAAFTHVSIQRDPKVKDRGILVMFANDNWTQVYSGPIQETSDGITFREDTGIVSASFSKKTWTSQTSFNSDTYKCDERSFGD